MQISTHEVARLVDYGIFNNRVREILGKLENSKNESNEKLN